MERCWNNPTFFLFIVLAVFSRTSLVVCDILIPPQNTVAYVGDTVVLHCTAVLLPPPLTIRITWIEYITQGAAGAALSDGYVIIPGHPNAAKYTILGTNDEYSLQITNVSLTDGGLYRCGDMMSAPPNYYQAFADLVVLQNDPVCLDIYTIAGQVVEGRYYTIECDIYFSGNKTWAPQMSWLGPGAFSVGGGTSDGETWSVASFIADRGQDEGIFECNTTILDLPDIGPAGVRDDPPLYATNTPVYFSRFQSNSLNLAWYATVLVMTPVKFAYLVGDIITCTGDSKPIADMQWTNMATLVTEPIGPTYQIPPELEGTNQTMRCHSRVTIEGTSYTLDAFLVVYVPAATTTPPTTPIPSSTTPAANGNCTDPTGLWKATNPDADLCIEVDGRGNVLTLIRNGTDTTFVLGQGKTMIGDYKHIGFVATWVPPLGVAGFVGECHSCHGVEAILISGLSRNYYNSPGCGASAGISFTKLYVFTRNGGPCRGMELAIANPNPEKLARMGVRALPPKNPIQ